MPCFTEADQGSLFFVIKGEIIEIIETPESIAGGSAFKDIEQVLNLVQVHFDFLDFLGVTLKATCAATRTVNGDILQERVRKTVGPWRRLVACSL